MKTVLIIGASGFLGKNLAEGLTGKYELLLPKHKELDLFNAQAVKEYFAKNKIDVVIHAAAVGIIRGQNQDQKDIETNYKMFLNVAAQSENFGKMLFCGSGAIYDKRHNLASVTEEDFGKSEPIDPYGLYKYKCSQFIEKSSNIVDLRIFAIFGKYEDYKTRFISNAICRSILGMPIQIFKDVKFDYLYIDDFVKIVEHFINHETKYNAYNIASGRGVKLTELSEKIKAVSGKPIGINLQSEGLANEYTADNQRLLAEMPNLDFTPLDMSIKALYNWYEDHKSEIDRNKFII